MQVRWDLQNVDSDGDYEKGRTNAPLVHPPIAVQVSWISADAVASGGTDESVAVTTQAGVAAQVRVPGKVNSLASGDRQTLWVAVTGPTVLGLDVTRLGRPPQT